MKKLVLLVLLFISFVANAQKGISYQAVILDPSKIEIPGQDIVGQPLVNGNVSVKFVILSGATSQFEEVQQTKTDAYGLVNLTIGSVANSAFNTITWDAVQNSLQVYVSFNNGASYTKVSDQKLTYTPYALFAETAGKLASTLGITGGGTGATTVVGARANLGLGNVDNTADSDKPISAATQAALNLKANVADVNAALNLKASAAMLAAHMAITVDTSMLATKAALTDLNNFAPKASPTFTGTVSGITKSMVGLGSVDNTSDADKPISIATQAALDLITTNSNSNSASASTSGTAIKLATARNINGVPFDGSADIIVTANAGTLTGTTLNSSVTSSSLTGVGTLNNLSVTNPIVGSLTGNAGTATLAGNITATTNSSLTTLANLSSVGTLITGTISLTTDIKTTGKLVAGQVNYPNTNGTSGQVLVANTNGNASWQSPFIVNEVTDQFIATAGQTVFTLSRVKSIYSKVKMNINGIRISYDAYTIVNDVLTYIAANNDDAVLVVGDRIQMEYYY
jgi:hypothetical protein